MKKQLLTVALLTGLSQLAAFFKLWFTARIFGVGSELDGYNLALVVPALITGVLSGLLQTGLFPVRSRLSARNSEVEVESFDRTVWWGCAVLGLLLAWILSVLSERLGQSIVPSGQDVIMASFMSVMPLAAYLVAISMITDCTGYILAMRGSFLIAACAPIANGILGGLVLAVWPQGGLNYLIWGTLGGAAVQLAICVYGLRLTSIRFFGPLATHDLSLFIELGRLGVWVLPGVVFSNLVVSLPPIWVASYGEGAVSAFGYAYRLHSSVLQLLVMASSTLILAKFSVLIASGDTQSIYRLLRRAALLSLALGVCVVLGVATVGEYALGILFGGKFNGNAAEKVTELWTWLSVGIGFSLLGNVFAKLWQAQARPVLLSVMAGIGLITLYLSFFVLKKLMDEQSVAIALVCSSVSVTLLGAWHLRDVRHKFLSSVKS